MDVARIQQNRFKNLWALDVILNYLSRLALRVALGALYHLPFFPFSYLSPLSNGVSLTSSWSIFYHYKYKS